MVRRISACTLLILGLFGCATSSRVASEGPADGASGDVVALVAQAQFRMELGQVAEGVQLFRKAVARAPGDSQLAEEFGMALAEVGMYDEAREHLLRAGDLSISGAATLGIILSRGASERQDLERAASHLRRGLDAVPQGAHARFTLVQVLIALEKGEEAMEVLKPLLEERPDDRRLQLFAGQALRLQGKNDEAIDHLREAEGNLDTGPQATNELVEALAREGRYEEAAEEWKQMIDRQGPRMAYLARYAALLMRAGDADKARTVLDDLLSRDPGYSDALGLKAVLEAAEGRLEEAAALYRNVLTTQPDNAGTALALAGVLSELHRAEEGRVLLDGLWQKAEEGALPEGAGPEIAQERAALELFDRQPEAALTWLEEAAGNTLGRRLVALWGEYFRQRRAYADGLAWLSAAQIDENPAIRRLRDGIELEFRLALGDETGSRELLTRLMEGDESDVRTVIGVLSRLRRYEEVVERSRQAIERFGRTPDLHFSLAAGLERSGDWDAAVTEFRALAEQEPENASVLNYLGYMFADRGVNLDEALTLISRAVELQPASGAYLDSLGWVHFRLGDLDRAEELLEKAVALEPHDATVQEHLGDLYRQRGEAARALERYHLALELELEEAGQKERIQEKVHDLGGDAR